MGDPGDSERFQLFGQRIGKGVCGEGAGKKAGQSHADLNGGKESSGIVRERLQSPGPHSASGEEASPERRLQRDQRHFGRGEKRIQTNQQKKNEQLKKNTFVVQWKNSPVLLVDDQFGVL